MFMATLLIFRLSIILWAAVIVPQALFLGDFDSEDNKCLLEQFPQISAVTMSLISTSDQFLCVRL